VVLLVRQIADQDRATPVRVQELSHAKGQEPRRRRQHRPRPVEGLGVGASRGCQALSLRRSAAASSVVAIGVSFAWAWRCRGQTSQRQAKGSEPGMSRESATRERVWQIGEPHA